MEFEELLEEVKKNIILLESELHLSIPRDCWVDKAIKLTEDLIEARNKKIPAEEYFKKRDYLYDESLTSLTELWNLNEILKAIKHISKEDKATFTSKLKKAFNAPLLLKDEDNNSNEGRNTLFELRLFAKLLRVGYDTHLPSQHPDILVEINGTTYFIECKRIFKKDTFIQNVQNAIDQLKKYSLNNLGYGIVAVSVTRYFHDGDKRLEAESHNSAKQRINYEMDRLKKENEQKIYSLFPIKIPALFLEYADRAVADKAYFMNLMDIIETSNGLSLFYNVRRDFRKLSEQIAV